MQNEQMRDDPLITIGEVARRAGIQVSAVRFYADQQLVPSHRNASGHRLFQRSVLRRIAFILIAQNLGYTLAQIQQALDNLPDKRTPTKADWTKLSRQFNKELELRIGELRQLSDSLTSCIGCGCLSLQKCRLYNNNDVVSALGSGPRYLLGNSPVKRAGRDRKDGSAEN